MDSIPTRRHVPRALLGLLFAMLQAAQAQAQSPTAPRLDPLDPKAQVPTLRYESAFAQFRRIGSDEPVPWREANDAVARIGGWRVYAREARQPEPEAAKQPAAPAQAPASAPLPVPAVKQQPAAAGHQH